ncbi:uncharacterized protein LOC143033440 isoform X2 [Oratosquilla oratoria]|uniref:uncharacterized protein LOC143033440 isoform X2 n=1 Tax=Oratosquilla oratoria TaxID=337810 RepID=UPI003F777B22
MSFEIPDWNGDSFSYHFDEAPDSQVELQVSCIRSNTGDQLKVKKRKKKKKNSKAKEDTVKKLQVLHEAEENTSSPRKKLKKGDHTTEDDIAGKEVTFSKDANLTVSSSGGNVTSSKMIRKQEVIENIGMASQKARKKKSSKRNKYRELADLQKQTRENREGFGIKKGNAAVHSSYNVHDIVSITSLDSHCKKSDAAIDISTGTDVSNVPLIADQKPMHKTVECKNAESSQVQSKGRVKKKKKCNVKQESNLKEVLSNADCGNEANEKVQSKKLIVRGDESDVEIICEVSDDEAGQDTLLQTDLEAFITTLNLAQFSTKKKAKKLCKNENMVVDNSVVGNPKSVLEESGDIKQMCKVDSQNLEVLDKSDQEKEIVTEKVTEHQVGGAKEKKRKRKKKNEAVNKEKVAQPFPENSRLISNDFVIKDKEECKEVAIENVNGEKKKIKSKKEHAKKINTMSSVESISLTLDDYANKDYKEDNIAELGRENLATESSFGEKVADHEEKRKKKLKRNINKTEEVHTGCFPDIAAMELSSAASPDKKHKFDKNKLAEMLKAADSFSKPVASHKGSGESLRDKMEQQLNAARFRFLNEKLYSVAGSEAQEIFKKDPESFQIYHSGYQQQVSKWPISPLDLIINDIKDRPSNLVVADFGCGEARLARSIPQTKVHSLDLVALNPLVTACNMANTTLVPESVDIVVFCLSLMGTSVCDFILEANRVLKTGGLLKVAEVESRFKNAESFVQCLIKYGFQLTEKDTSHKFFWLFDFKKKRNVKAKLNLPQIHLKACVYKKR